MPHYFPPACEGCPARATALGFVPPDVPRPGQKLVIYGESPGAQEVALGCGFVGPAGKKLRIAELRAGLEAGFPREVGAGKAQPPVPGSVVHANTQLCFQPGNKYNPEWAEECLRRHRRLHEPLAGLPVVSAGLNATRTLTGCQMWSPVSHRGSWLPTRQGDFPWLPAWLVATLHPSFIARGEGGSGQDHLMPLLTLDLMRALEVSGPVIPRFRFAPAREVGEQLSAVSQQLVSVDLESYGGRPTIVGFKWEHGTSWSCWWDRDAEEVLRALASRRDLLLTYHNAEYDLNEEASVGIPLPEVWVDTINTSARLDPSVPLGLQPQVLTHVAGSVAWKGLVDHRQPFVVTKSVQAWVDLWSTVMTRLGRSPAPFAEPSLRVLAYNALDGWAWDLAHRVRERLGEDGREYYRQFMQPLQRPLLELGQLGMWVDEDQMAFHRRACERLVRMGQRILDEASAELRRERLDTLMTQVAALEEARETELRRHKEAGGKGRPKFSQAQELGDLRSSLRGLQKSTGFNFDSGPQRQELILSLGLPLKKGAKTKGPTTDEKALSALLKRLELGRIKPRKGVETEKAVKVLTALIATKQWATWLRNFLRPTGGADDVVGELVDVAAGTDDELEYAAE